MRVIEFKFTPVDDLDEYLFRCLADRPLVDNKLHPDDVRDIESIANVLTKIHKKSVSWRWYRWTR